MDAFSAIVLGIVEGLTEFLPVSSTGHLILAAELLRVPESAFLGTFEIAVQLGAICAVLTLYGRRLLLDRQVLARVAAAFVPTGILGLALYKVVKSTLLGNEAVVVWALVLGGIVLVAFESFHKEGPGDVQDVARISYRQAVVIGVCQALAMIPGVSRSAATVVGGMAQGISRRAVVEFSFLLAVPTMAAATGLDLVRSAGAISSREFGLLGIGFAVSFVVAVLAVRFLLAYVRTRTFIAFGVYRIAAGIAFWAVVLR